MFGAPRKLLLISTSGSIAWKGFNFWHGTVRSTKVGSASEWNTLSELSSGTYHTALTIPMGAPQRLKVKCDELLSNVAFNVNVRRYTVVQSALPGLEPLGGSGGGGGISVHGITHFVDGSNVTLDQW
jgi:hypothetical protein